MDFSLTWLRRLLDRQPAPEATRLETTAEGFRIHHSAGVVVVRWPDVRSIFAYKLDRVTTDEIVLRFDVGSAADTVAVSEEWPGFQDLLGAMATHLGVGEGWYLDIMSPAFEAKPRYIYIRSQPS